MNTNTWPQFRTVAELAAFLDSLHAMTDDGAVTAEKWEPAQRALAALEAGRSGEAAGEVVESDNADGSTVLRVCWFGGIPPSGTKLYDHPQQPPPVDGKMNMDSVAQRSRDTQAATGAPVGEQRRQAYVQVQALPESSLSSASGQQPTPVGATDGEHVFTCRRCPVAVQSRWLEPPCPECGDPTEIDSTMKAHQQPAPSVQGLDGEWRKSAAPVSEPAASDLPIPGEIGSKLVDAASVSKTSLVKRAIEQLRAMEPWDGKTFNPDLSATLRELMNTPDAAGGEGLPESLDSRESRMVTLRRDETGRPSVWCDPEIADLVQALNAGGIPTIASCCGHGHRPGWIALRDGRHLTISPDQETHKRIEALFPVDINGDELPKPYDLQYDDSGRPQVLFTAEQMRERDRMWQQRVEEARRFTTTDHIADAGKKVEAKLSERKTVHEWLNDLHIPREEAGRQLCLLRRLAILRDYYSELCKQVAWMARQDHVVDTNKTITGQGDVERLARAMNAPNRVLSAEIAEEIYAPELAGKAVYLFLVGQQQEGS